MSELAIALRQVNQIETFCELCDRLPMPPVSIPQDPVRAAGLDPDVWHGLGMVGLWAALDAYTERKYNGKDLFERICNNLPTSMDSAARKSLCKVLGELDDIRHLYAHNFAGQADTKYFSVKKKRRAFQENVPYPLLAGGQFDGRKLTLTLNDLKYYISKTREILQNL